MATNIYNYDGSLLTTVPDGSINTTSTSIKFPGRGYVNYGQPIVENLLWMLQNFAAAAPPDNPINGQIWYDTSSKLLKVYDSTSASWIAGGGVVRSSTAPGTGASVGAFWYDTTKNQLHTWSGTAWLLVGPLGASDNLDPLNPAAPSYSRIDSIRVSDGTVNHQVWRVSIGNMVFAIISKDAVFTPNPAISGFAQIRPGINFNSTVTGVGINGDTSLFKNNQTNLPDSNNAYDLGSTAQRFATVYANFFNGTATSARYADLAERYESDKPYQSGTVVSIGGSKEITASSKSGDENVIGVISTNPAHLMNAAAGDDSTHPAVALAGRVPCKVIGQLKKGQRLMPSSMEGVACAWDPAFGTFPIIGRALVDKTSHGVELIEIVIGKN